LLKISFFQDCYLQVGEKKKTWENGKCMVFDDTYVCTFFFFFLFPIFCFLFFLFFFVLNLPQQCHCAVNNSDEMRVILLLDFPVGGVLGEEIVMDDDEKDVKDQKVYLDMMTTAYGYGVEVDDK
jgi:hypothetical protein